MLPGPQAPTGAKELKTSRSKLWRSADHTNRSNIPTSQGKSISITVIPTTFNVNLQNHGSLQRRLRSKYTAQGDRILQLRPTQIHHPQSREDESLPLPGLPQMGRSHAFCSFVCTKRTYRWPRQSGAQNLDYECGFGN